LPGLKPSLISWLEQDPWFPDQLILEENEEITSEHNTGFPEVMIKLEQEEESWVPCHQGTQTFSESRLPNLNTISQVRKQEEPEVPDQPGEEEGNIPSDCSSGFLDVIIKEEAPWIQGPEENADLAGDQSGNKQIKEVENLLQASTNLEAANKMSSEIDQQTIF
ncbi:UNVERIFIED_CONTAM: hypothetical protein K2H54_061239, partial [Gekko kuhli]